MGGYGTLGGYGTGWGGYGTDWGVYGTWEDYGTGGRMTWCSLAQGCTAQHRVHRKGVPTPPPPLFPPPLIPTPPTQGRSLSVKITPPLLGGASQTDPPSTTKSPLRCSGMGPIQPDPPNPPPPAALRGGLSPSLWPLRTKSSPVLTLQCFQLGRGPGAAPPRGHSKGPPGWIPIGMSMPPVRGEGTP